MTLFTTPQAAWLTGWRDAFFDFWTERHVENFHLDYENGFIIGAIDKRYSVRSGHDLSHLSHPNPPSEET